MTGSLSLRNHIVQISFNQMKTRSFAKDYQIAEIFGENFQVPQSYRYINNIKTIRVLTSL